MSKSASIILTEEKFDTLIEKYTSQFNNAPQSLKQLSTFCKEYGDNNEKNIKYSQLKPFYYKYNKKSLKNEETQTQNTLNEGINDELITIDNNSINYEDHWENYIKLYKNKPKNAKQLFNYLKNDLNMTNIKYKDARLAFNKLDLVNNNVVISTNDGCVTENNGDNIEIRLKIYHSTNDKVKNEIKTLFIDIIDKYKSVYNCVPKNSWNLFNYINDETKYKVKYTDVQFIMKYGLKEGWYKQDSNITETETDKKKIKKTKKVNKILTKDEYNEIIIEYKKEFNNEPKNAIQLMHFVNDYMKKGYKYNVIRVAFMKYQK